MTVSESVLLPEPFGPMIACTLPLRMSRSIPLRIVFPSTLTRRSLISRPSVKSLVSFPSSGGGGALGPDELRERHPVERGCDGGLEPEPDLACAAVLLAHAVHDGVPFRGADLRLDRAFERPDDVARSDLRRVAGEDVAAARPPLAGHEAGLPQRGDELLEVRLGKVLAAGDGMERDAPLPPVAGEVDHETHPVLASGGDVERGRDRISEHYGRNCTPHARPRKAPASRPCRSTRASRWSGRRTRRRSRQSAARSPAWRRDALSRPWAWRAAY